MGTKPVVYYKQNRLKLLRAFCTAAQCGSVSGAAERLFLSQPTVSLQIQALEREMDSVLFERRGPRIKLTPEGEVLFRLTQPLVERIDRLEESFHARFGRLEKGELKIAAGESTILYLLPEYVSRFREAYPGIRIKLHNVTGRGGLAMLRDDEADLAVGSMRDVPDDIVYRPSRYFSSTLITPLGHPLAGLERVTLKEVSRYGLILPPRHLATWRMVELIFNQHGLKFSVSMEAGGWEVIKKYVELGLGISIVTAFCLTGDEALSSCPLDDYFPKRSYGIVVRKGKYLSPQAQRFIELVDPSFSAQSELQ